MELLDLSIHLVSFAQVSLESMIERQPEIGQCKLWVEVNGFLKLTDGIFGQVALLVFGSELIMAIGFNVRRQRLFDYRSVARSRSASLKMASDSGSERIYYSEDALQALTFEFFRFKNLPSLRVLHAHIQAHLCRPDLQQRAGNKGIRADVARHRLRQGEVSGSEPIHVEGRIEGSISLPDSHVNISRDGVVMSNVLAGAVVVQGTLQGKLAASDRVEIHSGGSLIGEVTAGRVSIEDGAYCQARIDVRRPDPKARREINGNPTAE